MVTFQIQDQDGNLRSVRHDEFFSFLKTDDGKEYAYYGQGGMHLAMFPSIANKEIAYACRREDNTESEAIAFENRCRDEKGRMCRHQHDEDGHLVLSEKGHAARAKCSECPRDGWIGGDRRNCCIRNYCKVQDCAYCPHPRECHTPHSLEWLAEGKAGDETGRRGSYDFAALDSDIAVIFERQEQQTALIQAMDMLSQEEGSLIQALYWDGLSQRACGVKFGISKSKINRLHNNAIQTLKNALKNYC